MMDTTDLALDGTTADHDQPVDARDSSASGFPVPAWDRYANARLIGQGGMGKVFLAHDPRLRRDVAIKFVHGNDPADIRRLIAEARAQARVSHDRVCKVHEVGEVCGKVYIAMQYIDGRPLGELVDELTTEQKVMLMRAAAEGIHEAHRAGIIHRDIKPSNILVERGDDGSLRPYVMDFGLARSLQEDGGTLSGTVLGTPRYMAPEQARGEVGTLDRRADIYSLGATLYFLVTSKPPISGATALEVMHNLVSGEPTPPRAMNSDLSPDLEAIILKCLEVDRARRYESARALADDLARFLSGEPVHARATGPWYRLRKRLAKHRRLAIVSAIALVLALTGLGWGWMSRHEVAERERLARRFTEMVERIEAVARYSALSPRHDIRGDRATIRTMMGELSTEIRDAGAIAAAPGHYALGRGYLALDEDAEARAQLEAAWQDGFHEPRVAYALAVVMGRLYQQHTLAAERIEQKMLREQKLREVERTYRAPAMRYLAASRGAGAPSADYTAALLAFYTGDLDAALHHLDAIHHLPWFYEALKLRGDIWFARAVNARGRGEYDAARASYAAGRAAYAAAATVGDSAVTVYNALGELESSALAMELYGHGDVSAAFERGIHATTQALVVVPDHYDTLVLQARMRRSMAEHEANYGRGVEDLLRAALRDARRAIASAPSRPQAHLEIARVYRQWGESRQNHGDDPTEQLQNAIASAEAISPEDRDALYFSNLGLVFTIWADYDDQVGASAQDHRGRAIDAYLHALGMADQLSSARINLGINYFMRASRPLAVASDGDLRLALDALTRARSDNPKHVVPYLYIGQIRVVMAERARARGEDPATQWTQALEAYDRGLAINPKLPQLHNGKGLAMMAQAQDAWERDRAGEPLLDQALHAFDRAIELAPEQGFGHDNAGVALIQHARWQRALGQDPRTTIRAAQRKLRQALQLAPGYSTFAADLGMSYVALGEYELARGLDPRPNLADGVSVLLDVLKSNPNDAQAHHYLGGARALVARLHMQQHHGQGNEFATAMQSLERAIELAPENQEYQVALAELLGAWADFQRQTGADPRPLQKRGVDLIDKILALRPSWTKALAARAALDLVSQSDTEP